MYRYSRFYMYVIELYSKIIVRTDLPIHVTVVITDLYCILINTYMCVYLFI